MPYAKNDELPPAVKDNIADDKGKTIFRSAFNAALIEYKKEETAFQVAWSALEKAGYKKDAKGVWRLEVQQTDFMEVPPALEFARQLGDFEQTAEGLVGAFEVFKTGNWGDHQWTSADIDSMIANHAANALGYPPRVMHTTWEGRHSYSDKDVCGRVLELKRVDNEDQTTSLYAKMLFTEPETADKVRRKEPDQFSVSLSHPENGEGWAIKHIALTPIPGVGGLKGAIPLHEFTQDGLVTFVMLNPKKEARMPEDKKEDLKELVEVTDKLKVELTAKTAELTAKNATLKAQDVELTALRREKKEREFTVKLEKLVADAKITPAFSKAILPVLMEVPADVEFTDADKKKVLLGDALLAAFETLPKIELDGDHGYNFTQKPPADNTDPGPDPKKVTEMARSMLSNLGVPIREKGV